MEIAVGSRPGVPQRGGDEAYVAEIVAPGIVLLAVAHGFGRIRERSAPEVAAQAVRDSLKRRVRSERRDPRGALAAAFSAANARVYAHSGSTDDYIASGTSLTAALIVGDHAFVGHVGATRAYLGRAGTLAALTVDDALGDGVRLLTRALGTQPTLEPALEHVRLMSGDALVLSSGALHELLDPGEIADALRGAASSEDVTAKLLAIAGVRGGDGAGTVIVGRALTEFPPEGRARRPVRECAICLAAMIALTIVAIFLLHAMFAAA